MGFDRSGWQPVLRKLRRRFRVVLVDNRGTGQSDPADGPFRVADMAGDIVAVLDDAGIRTAHVLGVSLDGMVAQDLAAGYPDRVGGLVLVVHHARLARGLPHARGLGAADRRHRPHEPGGRTAPLRGECPVGA